MNEINDGDLVLPELLELELLDAAHRFAEEAKYTLPCVFRGHPVAHVDPKTSRIKNFSTITQLVVLSDGYKVFLIYRYPLSWIHSVTDNIQRWATGRRSTKTFDTWRWRDIMVRRSRIRLVRVSWRGELPEGMIAMPYIPNWNLWDILQGNVSGYDKDQVVCFLEDAAGQLNAMHAQQIFWGEPIVNNMIVGLEHNRVVICDTEVEYSAWTPDEVCMACDWRDFIFSACGACRIPEVDKQWLARHLCAMISSLSAKQELVKMCSRGRSFWQVVFWQGLGGALSCSWSDYDLIRQAITECK